MKKNVISAAKVAGIVAVAEICFNFGIFVGTSRTLCGVSMNGYNATKKLLPKGKAYAALKDALDNIDQLNLDIFKECEKEAPPHDTL